MVEITKKGRKTRSAGRFGVRYGRKNRKLVADIEDKMHANYKCSQCGLIAIKRIGTAIWRCTKCGYTFAGGTYIPQTSAEQTVLRSIHKAPEGLDQA